MHPLKLGRILLHSTYLLGAALISAPLLWGELPNREATDEGPWSDIERTTLTVPLVPDGSIAIDGEVSQEEYGNFPGQFVNPGDNAWYLPTPGGLWDGEDDSSFTFWLAHDTDNFYVGVQAKDDVVNQDNPEALWKDDSIEIVVDALNDRFDVNTDQPQNDAIGGHNYVSFNALFSDWDHDTNMKKESGLRWSNEIEWTYGETGEVFAVGNEVEGGWHLDVRFAKSLFEDPEAGNKLANDYVMGFNIGMDDDDKTGADTGDLELQYWWANRLRLVGWNAEAAESYTPQQIANGEHEADFEKAINPAGRLTHGGTGEVIFAADNPYELKPGPNITVGSRKALGQLDSANPSYEDVITIRNSGTENALTISAINVTGPHASLFAVNGDFPLTIEKQSQADVSISFSPEGRTGDFSAVLEIQNDDTDADDQTRTVEVSASVVNLQGPIAHFSMDEAAGSTEMLDVTGFGRHGTFVDGEGSTTLGAEGLAGGTALTVNGGGSGQVDGRQLSFTSFSVSMWFNANTIGPLQNFFAFGDSGGGTPAFALISDLESGTDLSWFVGEAPIFGTNSGAAYTAGQTHHLTVTVSDEEPRRTAIYVDGVEVAASEGGDSIDIDRSASVFSVGGFGILKLDGVVDDVQFYDRAISADDVQFLYGNPGQVLGVTGPPEVEFTELWLLGDDSNGNQAEFSQEQGMDEAPGSATAQDDDFYFWGVYPDPIGTVLNNEPFTNYDRAHVPGDPFNRIHFNLDAASAAADTQLQLTFGLCCFGAVDQGPSEHDMVFRLNGKEFFSENGVNSDRVVQETVTAGDFDVVEGANTIEIERTGGSQSAWVQYDYVRLEASAGAPFPQPTDVGGGGKTELDLLVLGADDNGEAGADANVLAFLRERFTSVRYMNSGATDGSETADVIVMSSTFGSGSVRGKFHNSAVPIVNWEEAIMDSGDGEFGQSLATMTKSTDTVQMTLGDHPIAGALAGTTIDYLTAAGAETLGSSELSAGTTAVGTAADGSNDGLPMLFVTDTGGEVGAGSGVDGAASPARRIAFPMTDATFDSLTDDGKLLLENSILWAAGIIGGEPAPIDGLLGYWRFNEGSGGTVADSSGNGNDGTIIAPGAAWVEDPALGSVYQSGGGSYVDFGTILPVIGVDTDFTWSFWVNADETDNNNIVFGNRWSPDGTDFAPREFIKFTPRVFEWHFNGGGENVPGENSMFVVGEWAHNLVVKSGSTLTYYRNGAEIASSEITGAPANAQPLYLGGQNGAENFSGKFDEVAVFNRALSVDEVAEVYARGQNGESLGSGSGPGPDGLPPITNVGVDGDGNVSFNVPDGVTADIQYSVDLLEWETIANGITGPYNDTDATRRARPAGFYRAAQ